MISRFFTIHTNFGTGYIKYGDSIEKKSEIIENYRNPNPISPDKAPALR